MRLIVTGRHGQLCRALAERAPAHGVELEFLGRPEFDLAYPESVLRGLAQGRGDVVINAAAYTAVDRAEAEEALATRINAAGAGAVATAAAARDLPLVHLSTDYVFDGSLGRPGREDDPPNPVSAYGRSKLAGERAVASGHPAATILRTSWVYAPFGTNFVRTMLRLGETRDEVAVVADQRGAPTSALDLADALISVARKRISSPADQKFCGIFHATGAGETTWADFAETIFEEAAMRGRRPVAVRRIETRDYPTAARRPRDSRLSNEKLAAVYGISLPDWRASTRDCVRRILAAADVLGKNPQ